MNFSPNEFNFARIYFARIFRDNMLTVYYGVVEIPVGGSGVSPGFICGENWCTETVGSISGVNTT